MQEIYSEKYSSADRLFEIVGFRDQEKVRIKIYEITERKRLIISKFEVTAVIEVKHDADISETKNFQQFVKSAKQFLRVYATS
jgi:hypothetical protein